MSKIKLTNTVVFRPVPKIWKSLSKNAKYSVIYGGTRAGKTYTIMQYIIYHAFRKSFNVCSVVSATFPHLRKGALQDFLAISEPFSHLIRANKTEHVYVFPSGAKLRFFSADEERKLRGIKQDWCFINEVNNIDESRFFQLLMRSKRIIVDFNPVARFWLDDFIEKQASEDVVIVQATYKDNPHLTPEEITSIEALRSNELFWKIYGLGERGDLAGRAFTNYEIVSTKDYAETLLHSQPVIGVDIGFTKSHTAAVALYRLDDYEVLAHELMYEAGASLEQLVSLLQTMKYDAVVVDSANRDVINLLREANIQAIPSYKMELRSSYLLLNKYRVKITDASKNLIKEAQNLSWKDDRNLEGADHAIDALRYALHKIHFYYT